jgi:hypothetical protein
MYVYLNSKIQSDFEGFSHLIRLYHTAKASPEVEINFSFGNTWWFEANLSAVLGAIFELLVDEGKKIVVSSIKPKIMDVLKRNCFMGEFGETINPGSQNTIISYKKFNPAADDAFMNYIKIELLSKPDFPKHSRLLGKKINESIFELYENARTHGRCKQIHTCGQYYPNKTPKRLDITIVDMGKTIKANVNEFLNVNLTGAEAIEWALEYGHTTKTGNISGGLGLDIIQEFIKLNNGKIQIISSEGYWEFRRGETKKMLFDNFFPGTIANLEFNLDDQSVYQLKEEISLDDIF